MNKIERVKSIYSCFLRGDIPAILEALTEDVVWEYGENSTQVPWLQPRRGRADVVRFFEALRDVDIQRFDVTTLAQSGDVVIALIQLEAVVKSTGRRVVEEDEVHIWYIGDDNMVKKFRHRADTHLHHLAWTR